MARFETQADEPQTITGYPGYVVTDAPWRNGTRLLRVAQEGAPYLAEEARYRVNAISFNFTRLVHQLIRTIERKGSADGNGEH